MSQGLTRALGAFVAGVRAEAVPREALGVVRTGFADCVGTMIAGSVEEAPQALHRTLAPPAGDARLYLTGPRVPAPEAAWINATAAHALDFDDVALRGHPSAVLVPAILAEGESLGASGAEMAAAYAAGYEVWAELAWRDPAQHHEKGWHPTGIFGAIGAAAACAALRRLDAERAAHALALGASMSAGLVANFGTMAKPYHAGRAAHAGVLAARLAATGFTGALDALEHPLGFLAAVSPNGAVDRDAPVTAGTTWRLLTERLNIKKYPLCYCTHRAIDGLLDLLAETPLRPEDIARIAVTTSARNVAVLRNARPQTGLEAKFSMQFAMACAVVAGRVGLAELTDAFVLRPDVQALLGKVAVAASTEPEDPARPGAVAFDVVAVETADGRRLAKRVAMERGSAELPLSEEELWTKFEGCLAAGGSKLEARAVFDALMTLESQPGVAALTGGKRKAA